MGQYEKAKFFYIKSKNILIDILGEKHLLVAESLENIALIHSLMGYHDKAISSAKESIEISNKELKSTLPSLSEVGKIGIIDKNAFKYETEQKYSWLEVQEEILKAYELVLKIFEK